MTAALQYDHTAYHRLSSSDDMHELAHRHVDELLALGEIICTHDLELVVGVYLAHRHHDLSDCERFVWQLNGEQWNAEPRVYNDSELIPTNWKIDGHDENAVWRPLEFCPYTEGYRPEIDAAMKVLENEAFLQEFKAKAIELSVEHIFGIALHQCREKFLQPGTMMFEQSYLSSRTTSAWPVSNDRAEESEGITLWHFTKQNGKNAVRACTSGNSRCCCGV